MSASNSPVNSRGLPAGEALFLAALVSLFFGDLVTFATNPLFIPLFP